MVIEMNSLNSGNQYARSNKVEVDIDLIVQTFVTVYNSRVSFFAESFLKKIKERNRKALAELLKHPLPPTMMDLRQPFLSVLRTPLAEDHAFKMADGKNYSFKDLKIYVPEWALLAERALMESDPALADKLMSPIQWNAKSAFEVTFTAAMNELKEIKKTKVISPFDHYKKWTLDPLRTAIEQVKAAKPPENALIGYGKKIPLHEAVPIAETLDAEFRKIASGKF